MLEIGKTQAAKLLARLRWIKDDVILVKFVCAHCKREVERTVRASQASKLRYCSRKCRNAAYYQRHKSKHLTVNTLGS